MTANVDAMVRAGVDAYRAGNKVEARTLLERAIELDGYNESAWLWLSAVVETKEEQQTCLENVLIINPDNERAQQGLKSIGIDPMTVAAPAQESAPAFEDDTFDDISFDDASFGSEDVFESAAAFSDTSSSNAFSEEDDLFGDIDFSADEDDFSLDDAVFETSSAEDDIYDDEDFSDLYDEGETYVEDDVMFGDGFDDGDDLYADIGTLEDFDDALNDSGEYDFDDDFNDAEFIDDPFAPQPIVDTEALTRSEYFAMIPDDVKEQRLPGINERVSSVHYAVLGVLGLVNLGALAFVALQFIG